jgi:hypothetical protein
MFIMDIRRLIKKELYPIFLELNDSERIHSEVWLSYQYYSTVNILYVRMWPGLRKTKEEEARISELIGQKINPQFRRVLDVSLLDWDSEMQCKIKKDLMVYFDETALYDYVKKRPDIVRKLLFK